MRAKIYSKMNDADWLKFRFENKFYITPGCWVWTAATRRGYRTIQISKKSYAAHRFSYELYVGEITKGLFVCHKCDNRFCVNPDHLFLGTQLDNVRDMIKKGRKVSVGKRGESSPAAKLKEHQVREIFFDKRSAVKIAKDYGVGKTIIGSIRNKLKWGHLWEK